MREWECFPEEVIFELTFKDEWKRGEKNGGRAFIACCTACWTYKPYTSSQINYWWMQNLYFTDPQSCAHGLLTILKTLVYDLNHFQKHWL